MQKPIKYTGIVAERKSSWQRFCRGNYLRAILLALLVLGAKWAMIEQFASDVPLNDQWDAEAVGLYLPLIRGDLAWDHILTPHNEHRIIPTKALAVALFWMTDHQWDPRLQMLVSAAIHASWFGLMGAWLGRQISPRWHPGLFVLLASIGVVPFAYENTLWAFQSQIYFALLFGSLAAWGLIFSRPNTWRWWVGVAAGICAVFSFGSGGLTGIALIAVVTTRAIANRRWRKADTWTAAVSMALVTSAWLIRTTVEGHAALRAQSWGEFSLATLRLISWPNAFGLLGGLLLWTPFAALITRMIGGHLRPTRVRLAAVFLGTFVAAQVGVLAVFRAAESLFRNPASRHQDLLAVGLVAGLLAVISLVPRSQARRPWHQSIAVMWLGLALLGLGRTGWAATFDTLPTWRDGARRQVALLRTFLETDNPAVLADRKVLDIGYPAPNRLIEILRIPETRTFLPSAIADGIADFAFAPQSGFMRNHLPPDIDRPPGGEVWSSWRADESTEPRAIAVSSLFYISRPWIEVICASSLDAGRIELSLEPTDGSTPVSVEIWGQPRLGLVWQKLRIPLRPGEHLLRVSDHRDNGWVAIATPREVSSWSVRARNLQRFGWMIFAGAGLTLLPLLCWPLRRTHA